MEIKRIGLIGHLAEGQEKFDGQTVSTRQWQNELNKMHFQKLPVYVDTYNYKKHPVSLLVNWLKCMFTSSHIVFMLSGNGMHVFLPLLFYSNKIFKRKLFHRVIGGNLCEYVEQNPKWVKYLNGFEVNWVQSNKMVEGLRKLGISNGEYLENFRSIKPIKKEDVIHWNGKPYRYCTFCRVSEAKGIGLAIKAIANINKKYGTGTAELYVYGPVEEEYREEFNRLVDSNRECVFYEGSVESTKAVDYLKKYYFHLFPTTWHGEGFPGTLIDCYNAALPTIASDWAYNSEYIKNNETGYLYDWKQPEQLEQLIDASIHVSMNTYCEMRMRNLKEADKYSAEVVMNKILKRMTMK